MIPNRRGENYAMVDMNYNLPVMFETMDVRNPVVKRRNHNDDIRIYIASVIVVTEDVMNLTSSKSAT